MKSVRLTTLEELFSVEFNFASEPHNATGEVGTELGTAVHISIICGRFLMWF